MFFKQHTGDLYLAIYHHYYRLFKGAIFLNQLR